MKKDIEEYISNGIRAETPKSLSKEKIVSRLPEEDRVPSTKRKSNKQIFYKIVAAAAAVAIAVSGVAIYQKSSKPKSLPKNEQNSKIEEGFGDYEEIYAMLKAMRASYTSNSDINLGSVYDTSVSEIAGDMSPSTANDSFTAKEPYGTTNTQEENIDEGDIIKTDGKNIYLADRENKKVYIVKADNGEMTPLSEISFSGDLSVCELYVSENKLTVVYVQYDYSKQPLSPIVFHGPANLDIAYDCCYALSWVYSETHIAIYDISNAESPEKLYDYCQSGDFISSRAKDGKIYLVSSYCVDITSEEYEKNCIPKTAENGAVKLLPAEKIKLVKDTEAPTYSVIGVIDVNSAKTTDTSAIFGDASNVYATENSFYLVEQKWDNTEYLPYLNILKFNFTESGVEYLATAKAEGRLHDNLSMNEYGDYFRIATTCTLTRNVKHGDRVESTYIGETNKLFIFDENMNRVGLLDGFANDEQIRSARYIGNYAYIVTFRQTDPLFVINLSDPSNPKIEASLKLPGFSSYLHPMGNGILVGVGQNGDEENAKGNMKVSLFSVADPKNPKELGNTLVGRDENYVVSNVSYSYKAFIILPNGEFAVPFTYYSDDSNNGKNAFIRYKVSGNTIAEISEYSVGTLETEIIGGTYIGNYFYAYSSRFTDRDNIAWQAKLTSFNMVTNEKSAEIML